MSQTRQSYDLYFLSIKLKNGIKNHNFFEAALRRTNLLFSPTSDFIKQQEHQLVTASNSAIEPSHSVSVQSESEPSITLQPTALISVVEAVVKRFIPTSTSRLTYLRELEEAYQNGWLLSTSEVANLLGLAQKTITSYGQEFSDAGFVFTRVGMRKRGEIAWAIDKQASDWSESLPSSTKNIKEAFSEAFDP